MVATSENRSTPKTAIGWTEKTGWQGITDADRQEWLEAYPLALLDQELAKATAWLKANPARAKRSNWRKFLVGWLTRCQDGGGSKKIQAKRVNCL